MKFNNIQNLSGRLELEVLAQLMLSEIYDLFSQCEEKIIALQLIIEKIGETQK